jgi:hypothetical protein
MAQPSTRQEFIDYCLRKLGAPVLEINVAEEQIEDLVDDALQLFNERCYDGSYSTFLKYEVTQSDIDRGLARPPSGVGIATTSSGAYDYHENSNFIPLPPHVLGVRKIFKFEGENSISSGMFSVKYQLFLNDVYHWGSLDLLTYAMTKSYLSDIDFLLTTEKQIRFNKRQGRLYLDVDYNQLSAGNFLIIDCDRLLDPSDYSKVWNDNFLKQYATSLIKRQWGQNLIKFQGVRLPGGLEFNGRTLYEDAQREIDTLMDKMSSTYELPPLDMIG